MVYALNCGGGWTGDLIIADWHDLQNNVASEGWRQEIQVQRSRNQEIAGSIRLSLRRWLRKTRRSRGTSNLMPSESRGLRRGRVPSSLGWASGGTLQCARGDSLQKENGLQTFLKLIATLWKQGQISGVCLRNKFIYRQRVMPREQLCVPKSHHYQIRERTLTS